MSARRAGDDGDDDNALDDPDAVGPDDLPSDPSALHVDDDEDGGGAVAPVARSAADRELLGDDDDEAAGDDADSASGNVRVVVRVRPLLDSELANAHSSSLMHVGGQRVNCSAQADRDAGSAPPRTGVISVGMAGGAGSHEFSFDAVLTPQHDQVDVFEAGRVDRMLQQLLKGYHGTIFAYGQTGSGKTFSMDGITYATKHVPSGPAPDISSDAQQPAQKMKTVRVLREPSVQDSGLSLRCINELFGMIAARRAQAADYPTASADPGNMRYTVRCSFIQIYQESVFDLLADAAPQYVSRDSSKKSSATAGLRIRWSPQQDFFVENLYIFPCTSAKETRNYFLNGMKKRLVASHRMNASSSRSHCIFTLYVDQSHALQPDQVIRSARLSLVDLAGSERVALTGATGDVLTQSIGINKSLFVLRKVIKSLSKLAPALAGATKQMRHIPFRDSVLTRLLKHSLGGNCLTLMLACLNPSDAYAEENLSTLNYAALAKSIRNNASRNEDPQTALIRKLRAEVKLLRGLLARAKQNIVLGSNSAAGGGGSGFDSSRALSSASANHPSPSAYLPPSSAASAGEDGVSHFSQADIAHKLIDSVNHLKEIIEDNGDLRKLYEENAALVENLEFSNATLNSENDELRDRVHFLETVIVDGQGEEILKSPDELTVDDDGENQTPGQRELLFELNELREENQRLKTLMASDYGPLSSGAKSSRRSAAQPAQSSAPLSVSQHFAPASSPSSALPLSSQPPRISHSSSGNRPAASSSYAFAPAVVYRPPAASAAKGRTGRTASGSDRKKAAAYPTPRVDAAWDRAREVDLQQDRWSDDLPQPQQQPHSSRPLHQQAWNDRTAPSPVPRASFPQSRPNAPSMVAANPTIALYMQRMQNPVAAASATGSSQFYAQQPPQRRY